MRLNPFRMSREESESFDNLVQRRSISFQDVWGQGRDAAFSAPMVMEHALTLDAVYAATSLIADLVSSFPLVSYRKDGKGVNRVMDPPAQLIMDPTEFGTAVDWTHRAVISMALRGNAFGYITEFMDNGYPRRIEWLHPDEVSIRTDRSVAPPQWFWLGKPIDNSRFVHIPYYTLPGRILGVSPIKAYAMTIEQGLLAAGFGRDFLKNGATPSGVIKTDKKLQPGDADTVSREWRRRAAGRGIPVLGESFDYKPIGVTPEESQFLLTMKASATRIASIYHLPPEMIGGDTGSSTTYANVEMRALDIARFALVPYIKKIETAMFQYLPRPQSARYDMDEFQRPDMESRYRAYSIALGDTGTPPFMLPSEVREREPGLPPIDAQLLLDAGLTPEQMHARRVLAPQQQQDSDQQQDGQNPGGGANPVGGKPSNGKGGNAPVNDTSTLGKAGTVLPRVPRVKGNGLGAAQGSVTSNSLNGRKVDPRLLAIAIRERGLEADDDNGG